MARRPADEAAKAEPDPAAELERLKAEVAALLAELRRAGAEGLGALGREARARAGEAAEGLGGEWADLERRLVEEVRANPLRALGLAALAGLIAGLLVRR
ncbi:MAG: hypothetical protein N2422_05435 [Rhodobacteraceae bacterium]|nr:hypothetical protein [Paracoccaceae bacterium]